MSVDKDLQGYRGSSAWLDDYVRQVHDKIEERKRNVADDTNVLSNTTDVENRGINIDIPLLLGKNQKDFEKSINEARLQLEQKSSILSLREIIRQEEVIKILCMIYEYDRVKKLDENAEHYFKSDLMSLHALSDEELAAHVLGLLHGRPGATSIVKASWDKAASRTTPSIPLPNKAPRLWQDRPADECKLNPSEFIRKVYAPWLGHGLARHHVGELDKALGKAYSSWTKTGRHPEDIITEFAKGNPHGKLDDAEALRRYRSAGTASKAKAKAAKKSQLQGLEMS